MELEQAMENRRSIRKYKAKPVETEKIRKMIQAAGLAPSWKNSQVTRYYVAQSEEAVAKVREALPEFNRNNTENAPVLITTTIVKDRSGYNMDGSPTNELGNGWGYYDCGLQNMNLLLKSRRAWTFYSDYGDSRCRKAAGRVSHSTGGEHCQCDQCRLR